MSRKNFAHLLSKHIEVAGVKQTHVASTASISYNYLQRLLAGGRNPSEQVVQKLAEVLHLTAEETGELFTSAGYAPPAALLHALSVSEQRNTLLPTIASEPDQITRLTQQFYRLSQEIPEVLQAPFLEEIQHLLNYARYKYVLSGGENLLNLNMVDASFSSKMDEKSSLNLLAKIVGQLQIEPGEQNTEKALQTLQETDDLSLDNDTARSDTFVREILIEKYRPQFVAKLLTMLQEGVAWDVRCHITKALPTLCRFDVSGSERLMTFLRIDKDEMHGVDIRRRLVEALPDFFEASPLSLPTIIKLLYPIAEDDIYVAIATTEACGDIQTKMKHLLEYHSLESNRKKPSNSGEQILTLVQHYQPEISKIQRQMLFMWGGKELESIQFSMTLHDLLCAPDTMLHSLREGSQSSEKLLQFVTARYLERLLPIRPIETLELYKVSLQQAKSGNVRRTVAKALPKLLHCLQEASLSVRALGRTIIISLATDSDIYIRRAVADCAMQIFYIDREFLLILLRQMHNDRDQNVRSRLQPVVLHLAQIWLTSYAETAGLIDSKVSRHAHTFKTMFQYGDEIP